MAVYTIYPLEQARAHSKPRAYHSQCASHVYELCCGEVEFDKQVDKHLTNVTLYTGLEKIVALSGTMIVLRFGAERWQELLY